MRTVSRARLAEQNKNQLGPALYKAARQWLKRAAPHVITINLDLDCLVNILKSGQILNAYESGTTLADTSPFRPTSAYYRRRSKIENKAFGLSDSLPARNRPRYAAVNWLSRPCGAAPVYGINHIVLKPALHKAATYCCGDLFHNHKPDHLFTGQLLYDMLIKHRTNIILSNLIRSYRIETNPLAGYIEAHIFQPLTLDDIQAIRICKRDWKSITRARLLRRTSQTNNIRLEVFDLQ